MPNTLSGLYGALSPTVRGYEAARQGNQQADMNELTQASGAMGLLAKIRAEQEQQMLRQQLQGAQTPQEAIDRLIATGRPEAIAIAAKLHSLMPKPKEDRVVASGGALVSPEGTVKYQAPFKPAAEKGEWSEPYELGGATVQRNNLSGEIRTAVTRPPQIRIDQPSTPTLVYRKREDGKFDAIDFRTGRIEKDVMPSGGVSASVNLEKGEIGNSRVLRREFDQDASIKRLNEIEPQLDQVASYMKNLTTGKGKQDGANDEALIKAYLSMNNVKGDRITNLDRKVLSNFGHLPARVLSGISSFVGGRDLGSDARNMMWQNVAGTATNMDAIRKRKASDILSRAKSQRVRPELIFADEEFSRYGIVPD